MLGLHHFNQLAMQLKSPTLLPELLSHLSLALRDAKSGVGGGGFDALDSLIWAPPARGSGGGGGGGGGTRKTLARSSSSSSSSLSAGKRHYLDQLDSVGSLFKKHLSERYFGLVEALVQRTTTIGGSGGGVVGGGGIGMNSAASVDVLSTQCQLYLLDCINLEFKSSDIVFWQKSSLLSFLMPLLRFPGRFQITLASVIHR
jgi:hypothetical protein